MGGSSSSSTPSVPSYTVPTGYARGPITSESAGTYPVRQFSLSLGGVPSYQTQQIQRPQTPNMAGYGGAPNLDFNAGYDAFKQYQQMAQLDQVFQTSPSAMGLYSIYSGLPLSGYPGDSGTYESLMNYYGR